MNALVRGWVTTLLATFLLAFSATTLARDTACETKAETRRLYVDGRFGQLHVHHASPLGEVRGPPLVLLHQTPLSGRMYSEVIGCLAQGRDVYALDTPGYGESDPPPAPADIETYALAVGDFLATLGEPADLLGYHTGVLLAVELAVTQPERVHALVLLPRATLLDREDWKYGYFDAASADFAALALGWLEGLREAP